MSDTITVGNIHNSIATAIGDGATAVVHFINNPLHPDDRPKTAVRLPPLTPAFTGRLSLIQNIAGGFVSGNGYSVVVTQAISGLGGVGKTQAALAYAHLYRAAYDIIWQLTADTTTALDDGVRQLGLTLELPLLGLDVATMRGKVLSRLSQSGERVLLIYDNADSIAPRDLRPYLPNGCHTLITSRRDNSQWGGMAKPLTLGVFTEDEGMAFWERRLAPEVGLLPKARLLNNKKARLLELGKALGWLPVAMEQAAAFMTAETMDAAAYLHAFTQEREALWQREDAPNLYHATVATTWKMAFDHAKKTEGAADLLNLLSFFAPDDIPLDVVWDGAGSLPDGLASVAADKWKRRDSLKALRTYSLLTITDDNAAMHRPVQSVARRRMGDGAKVWVDAAMKLLSKAYHFDKHDMGTWAACGQLLPHVTVAVNLAADLGVENTQAARLNNEAGLYLRQYGDSAGALPFIQQALDINRKMLGDNHPDTVTSLNNMGYLLQEMGKYEAARPVYHLALDINKKVLGDDHPDTATSFGLMGNLLRAMGEYEAARPFYQQALDIRINMLGDDHPDQETEDDNIIAQSRRFEAAMPKSVYAGDTTEVLVMIPRAGDLGLRGHLPVETEAGDLIEAGDVSAKKLHFDFPADPLLVYIKAETSSRDFEVERPLRTVKIHPDREGDYETFFLTALRAVRRARVAVKLFIDKELTDSLGTVNLSVPIIDANSAAGKKLEEERKLFILADSSLTYIAGDNVGGDKINAIIKNSSSVAIGRESSATVTSDGGA